MKTHIYHIDIEAAHELNLELTDTPTRNFIAYGYSCYIDEDDDQTDHRGSGKIDTLDKIESKETRVWVMSKIEVVKDKWTDAIYTRAGDCVYTRVDFKSLEEFLEVLRETDDSEMGSRFVSEQEHLRLQEKKKLDEEAKHRREMEWAVKQIMQKYKLERFDSMETLAAIYFEQELDQGRWQDKLNGLAEDGLCTGWGITAEQFIEERNYFHDKLSQSNMHIDEMVIYLEKEFPLLVAKFMQDKEKYMDAYRDQLEVAS